MYSFTHVNYTKVYFGKENEKEFYNELIGNYKNILIVFGNRFIVDSGLLTAVKNYLDEYGINIIEYGGISSNPTDIMVDVGVKKCKEYNVKAILAIGGGSVIDCAKAMSILCFKDCNFWEMTKKQNDISNALPLFCIPTIAGTGSEMNNSCVITNSETKEKRGFSNDFMYPKASYLNPELTFSVNRLLTACGSIDIISHILDTAYLVKSGKMLIIDDIMISLCKNIIYFTKKLMHDPCDYDARANLMWASCWGLNGYLKSGKRPLAACHVIEHEISARYNISHSLGMAVLLPKYLRYLSGKDKYIFNLVYQLMINIFRVHGQNEEDLVEKGLNLLEFTFYNDFNLPKYFDMNLSNNDLKEMADRICWGSVLPGVVELDKNDIKTIISMCFKRI